MKGQPDSYKIKTGSLSTESKIPCKNTATDPAVQIETFITIIAKFTMRFTQKQID